MNGLKPFFLGISGGSASGKTFLLNHILDRYSDQEATLISSDNYYRSREVLPREADGEINFDHPDSLDLDRLEQDLIRISNGESVTVKEYTFNNPKVEPTWITYNPSPIILVEGLFVFHHPGISKLLDLKIFVDADEHIRLSRRIRRDAAERGYQLDEVLDYYTKYVAPMYRKYIEPYRDECDLVLPNNLHMDRAVRVLESHLDVILKTRTESLPQRDSTFQ